MLQVNIGGRLRPFKFGFNAIDIFCRQRNITLAQFEQRLAEVAKGNATVGEIRDMVYAGLAGGALGSGQPVQFTAYNVGDWLDELLPEELAKIMQALTESLTESDKKKALQQPAAPKA